MLSIALAEKCVTTHFQAVGPKVVMEDQKRSNKVHGVTHVKTEA